MFFAEAMDLNKRPGAKQPTSRKDAEKLALTMEVLYLERDGLTPGKAKKEIAKKNRRKSLRSIQRYYKENESDARWIFKNFKI